MYNSVDGRDKPGHDLEGGVRTLRELPLPLVFQLPKPSRTKKSMGWRHFGREPRRFQRSPRHSRPIPSGRKLLVLGRPLRWPRWGQEKRESQNRPAWAPLQIRSGSGLMRAWRQPLRRYRFPANAPFIGSSVTGRARLVAAAVSAHEARFDQATETNDSTNFDFLKEIVVGGAKQRRRFSGIRAETRAPSALPAPLCLREPPGSAVPPGCPIGPWGWQNRNARPAPG